MFSYIHVSLQHNIFPQSLKDKIRLCSFNVQVLQHYNEQWSTKFIAKYHTKSTNRTILKVAIGTWGISNARHNHTYYQCIFCSWSASSISTCIGIWSGCCCPCRNCKGLRDCMQSCQHEYKHQNADVAPNMQQFIIYYIHLMTVFVLFQWNILSQELLWFMNRSPGKLVLADWLTSHHREHLPPHYICVREQSRTANHLWKITKMSRSRANRFPTSWTCVVESWGSAIAAMFLATPSIGRSDSSSHSARNLVLQNHSSSNKILVT